MVYCRYIVDILVNGVCNWGRTTLWQWEDVRNLWQDKWRLRNSSENHGE